MGVNVAGPALVAMEASRAKRPSFDAVVAAITRLRAMPARSTARVRTSARWMCTNASNSFEMSSVEVISGCTAIGGYIEPQAVRSPVASSLGSHSITLACDLKGVVVTLAAPRSSC